MDSLKKFRLKQMLISAFFILLILLLCFLVKESSMKSYAGYATKFDIQDAIKKTIAAGGGTINVPTGTYHIPTNLDFSNAHNLTLDGHNSIFVFSPDGIGKGGEAFNVAQTKNVTLKNFTVDYDPLPFTQGTVIAVGSDGSYYDVRIDQGYRTDAAYFNTDAKTGGLGLHPFDPTTRKLKRNASTAYPSNVVTQKAGVLRFSGMSNSNYQTYENIRVGDLVATSGSFTSIAVFLDRTARTKIDKVTLWASAGAGVYESGGDGGNDACMTITRGPRPTRATQDRLISITRDGWDSIAVKTGPTIHDSLFEYAMDDNININNPSLQVVQADYSKNIVHLSIPQNSQYTTSGDHIAIYDGKTYKHKADTTVIKVSGKALGNPGAAGDTWQIADSSQIAVDDIVYDADRGSSNTVIRDNTFRNTDGVGAIIGANRVKFIKNTVTEVTHLGVQIGSALSQYLGGAFPHDVLISDNTISDIGIGNLFRSDIYWPGTAAILVANGPITTISALNGNREIQGIHIINNSIRKIPTWGLAISNASGIDVKGNMFSETNYLPPGTAGQGWGVTPKSAIFIRDADHITFEAPNSVINLGAYAQQSVFIDSNADSTTIDTGGISPLP